jgi:hypothetical protein
VGQRHRTGCVVSRRISLVLVVLFDVALFVAAFWLVLR